MKLHSHCIVLEQDERHEIEQYSAALALSVNNVIAILLQVKFRRVFKLAPSKTVHGSEIQGGVFGPSSQSINISIILNTAEHE